MKTKLDVNGYTVYTVPTKEDCLIALNNLKEETLKNKYMTNFAPQIDHTINAVNSNDFNEVIKIKHNTNFKPLRRILYIFEKDYLHELWTNENQ